MKSKGDPCRHVKDLFFYLQLEQLDIYNLWEEYTGMKEVNIYCHKCKQEFSVYRKKVEEEGAKQ